MTTPNDAENLAKERATKKTQDTSALNAQTGSPEKMEAQPTFVKSKPSDSRPDLTSYDDLVGEYQTTFVRTSSDKVFEIESIGPGEFMMIFGSPIAQVLSDIGIDLDDPEREKKLVDISIEDKVDVLLSHDFQEFAENIVCAGVISINFLRRPQRECDQDKQEVSVSRLHFQEMCELFNAIIRLSVSGEEMGLIEFFREGSEEVSGERDSSPSNSDSLPHTPIGVAVSQETGS